MIKKIFNILNSKEKIRIIIIFFLIVISSLFELLGIGILYPFLTILFDGDLLTNEYYTKYLSQYNLSRKQILNYSLLIILIIYISKNFFVFFTKWSIQSFGKKFRIRIFKDLITKYLFTPYEKILRITTESVLKKINFAMEFSSTIIHLLTLVSEILVLSFILILLFMINTKITTLVLSFFIILSLVIYLISKKKLSFFGKKVLEHYQNLSKHLLQSIGGIKEIKILGRQNFFFDKMSKIQFLDSEFRFKTGLMLQVPTHVIEICSITFILCVIFYLTQSDFSNIQIISIVGIYVVSFTRLMPSSTRILAALQNIKYNYPVFQMLEKELKNIDVSHLQNKHHLKDKRGKEIKFIRNIKLKNIFFKYDKKKNYVFKKLNLKIKFGNIIGVYGKSGCGKSTLSEIIIGLLKPQRGEMLIDNVCAHSNIESWHKKIGVVSQNPYFLNDTIKNNITFGFSNKNISEKRIKNVIKQTNLEEVVKGLPNKINTIIGERGITLSGGQLQRLALARALYSGSKLLILDEATNALDKINEESIFKLIKKFKKKITIIIISHKISNFKYCDFVYKFKNGSLKKI